MIGLVISHVHSAHAGSVAGFIAYMTAFLFGGVWLVLHVRHHLDEPGDDDSGEGGGGGGTRPKPRGPRPEPEPDWWPDFERQFAAYVDSRLTRAG